MNVIDTYLDKPIPDARDSDEIYRSVGGIAWQRSIHTATRLLARVMPTATTNDLEFEYRYRRYLAEFGEADSDIWVSTYSKSGTTWMQVILYQLITDGRMDFDHLSDQELFVLAGLAEAFDVAAESVPTGGVEE